jgi:hypothetical protein
MGKWENFTAGLGSDIFVTTIVYSPFQLPISFMDKTKNNYGEIKKVEIVQRPNL